ncbi:MAG: hypothetical protein Q7T05_03715 [Dehalococcoidia bacterium]|nr:hypothetical protein [Dehalococcoidia bacterium]
MTSRRTLAIAGSFGTGIVFLVAILLTAIFNPNPERHVVMFSLLWAFGAVCALMVAIAVLSKDNKRWVTSALLATLLLLFSALAFLLVGLILSLLLLGYSLWRLRRRRDNASS